MTAPTLARLPIAQQEAMLRMAALSLRARTERVGRRELYRHQVPPPQPWDVWLLLGGRGSGKTEAGARYVDGHARGEPCLPGAVPHRIAIVAPSHDDAVDTCVRGETGILRANPSIRFRPGALLTADLTWPNGAEAELFGTFAPEDVERFRGPQHCLVWGDEFAAWRKLSESWDMLQFGLRLGPHPHVVLTTTPKRRPLLRQVIAQQGTITARARTADNPGLPEERRAALYRAYGGTTLGRQELDAEIIDDVPGALWSRDHIVYRVPPRRVVHGEVVLDMARIVVAIDPAVTSTEASDETGIVVDGLGIDGMGYTLADLSGRMPPTAWARRAIEAYRDFRADSIIAEANNGGDLVSTVIASIDANVPVRLVHASRGKRVRAEPVQALYEQGRWYHAEPFPELEDQQCSYTGDPGEESPDRLDAHVWGVTELMVAQTWAGSSNVAVA